MVSVENGKRPALVDSNQQYSPGSRGVIAQQLVSQIFDLGAERLGSTVSVAFIHDAPRHLRDTKIAKRQLAPLRPRKSADAMQTVALYLRLEPLGSIGKFSPERSVTDEEQGATHFVLFRVTEIGFGDKPLDTRLIFLELWALKVVPQKL